MRPATKRRRRIALAVVVGALGSAFVLGVAFGRHGDSTPGAAAAETAALRVRLPSTRSSGGSRSTPVPIFMYHVLGDAPAGSPFPDLFVRPSDFQDQMRWLEGHGYHAVTLDAVWRHWHRGRSLPARPIVVSFDDGYRATWA